MFADPEAFDVELVEEYNILHGEPLIEEVWEAIRAEKAKGKNCRMVRVARTYLSRLRDIYYQGMRKQDAKILIDELCLESTVPLNDLEVAFDTVDDGGEIFYQEVDSYTRSTPPQVDAEREAQLFRDRLEVMEELKLIDQFGEPDPVQQLFAKVILDNQPRRTEARIVYSPKENLEVRVREELLALGHDPAQVEIAVAGMFAVEDDEPVWFDEREPDIAQQRLSVEAMKMDSFNPQDVFEAKAYFRHLINLRNKVKTKKGKARKEAAKRWYDMAGHMQFKFQTQSIAVAALSNDEYEDIAEHIPLYPYSSLAEFIDLFGDVLMDEAYYASEPEGAFSMNEQLWDYETNPAMEDGSSEIHKVAQQIENDVIQGQFYETSEEAEFYAKEIAEALCIPQEARQEFISGARTAWTRPFARGVFGALALGKSDIDGAGYARWRYEVSPAGARAYAYAWEKHKDREFDERRKMALRAFWNTGKIVALNPDGADILTVSGKTTRVSWPLVRWKIQNLEIDISKEDLVRLKSMLKERHWGNAVVYYM